ncbi:arrestin domain-containing protein 3-like isoform X2 [Daktulosphaira vitifoliae]|nr:arrestin domain-containing protein 3-like isoform X2 [Daktulosphaira vitifoliae]
MGVKSFQIIYDKSTAIFMPGQSVSGKVLLVTNKTIKIRSIKMTIKGRASVSWHEKQILAKSTKYYTAKEEYFKNQFTLFGDNGEVDLEENEHDFPFSILLPQKLPSTYNGRYGNILYKAKVTIDIPWAIDKVARSTFQVISPLDLNEEQNLAEPVKIEKEKNYCCCCCRSGPMNLIVCLPYSGFVPGQNIPFDIELNNDSNVAIKCVKIKLEKDTYFKATRPSTKTNKKSKNLAKLSLNGIREHDTKTLSEQILIPSSLEFSNLKNCQIIEEKYVLKVETCVGILNRNTNLHANISIGNIPLVIAQDALPIKCQT